MKFSVDHNVKPATIKFPLKEGNEEALKTLGEGRMRYGSLLQSNLELKL